MEIKYAREIRVNFYNASGKLEFMVITDKMDKTIVKRYLRLYGPCILLIPLYFIFPRSIAFTAWNGALIFSIIGYYSDPSVKWVRNLLTGLGMIFLLATVIVSIIAFRFYDHFSLANLGRALLILSIFIPSWTLAFVTGYILKVKVKDAEVSRLIQAGIIVSLLMINLGNFGWGWKVFLGGILFTASGFLMASARLRWNLLMFSILAGPMFLVLSAVILKDRLYHGLPILIIIPVATSIGISLKLLYLRGRNLIYIVAFLSLILYGFGYFGMLNWVEFIFSKKYATEVNDLSLRFMTLDGREIDETDFAGRTTVIYFWNITCKPCREKMPELEKLTKDYSGHENVRIYAVVVPLSIIDTNSRKVMNILSQKFDIYYGISLDNMAEVTKNFNFHTFPHVVVVDEKGEVILNGLFNNDPTIRVNNISTVLSGIPISRP